MSCSKSYPSIYDIRTEWDGIISLYKILYWLTLKARNKNNYPTCRVPVHRIIGLMRLEGTSEGLLLQPPRKGCPEAYTGSFWRSPRTSWMPGSHFGTIPLMAGRRITSLILLLYSLFSSHIPNHCPLPSVPCPGQLVATQYWKALPRVGNSLVCGKNKTLWKDPGVYWTEQ